jgi:arginine/lysine/ornithine decarboxylase
MTDENSSTRDSDQQVNPIYKKILINRKFKFDVRDVLAADSEEVPAKEAVGRVSAEIKYKCPPGFPVLVYGEEILPEHIELFGPLEKLKVMV